MRISHSKDAPIFEPVTISILCETRQELEDLTNAIRRAQQGPSLANSRETAMAGQREGQVIGTLLDALRAAAK